MQNINDLIEVSSILLGSAAGHLAGAGQSGRKSMAKVVHTLDLLASVRRSIRSDEAGLYTLVASDADDLKGVAVELRESIVPPLY